MKQTCNDLIVLLFLISGRAVRDKGQTSSLLHLFYLKKKRPSVKFKYFLPALTINIFLLFSQILFGQENSKNIINEVPKAKLIESYRSFKSDEASMIIDLLRTEVDKNPNSKGFIVFYCGKICQYGEIEAHLRGIKLSLQFKGVDTKQFFVVSGGFQEKATTEFWLVPKDVCPPIPNSSIDFKDVKFKGIYKKQVVDYECCFN